MMRNNWVTNYVRNDGIVIVNVSVAGDTLLGGSSGISGLYRKVSGVSQWVVITRKLHRRKLT